MVSKIKFRLTKRALDGWDSAAIPSSFLRLSLFLAGRMSQVHETGQVNVLSLFLVDGYANSMRQGR